MGESVWLYLINQVNNEIGRTSEQDAESDDRSGLITTPTVHDQEDDFLPRYPETFKCCPSNTLIIFDWDDTLLCSSAIHMQLCTHQQLDSLSRTVEATLRLAMQLGEVMIVTNGVDWWVDDSCRRFLPALVPLLGEVTVKSARADYEPIYPGDPFAWKREAFQDILRPRPRATNLVVLGDSLSEIQAARGSVHCMVDTSLAKTVKFVETPSADELIGQLRRVSVELGQIVDNERHSSTSLERRPLPGQVGTGVSWASGWRLWEDPTIVSPLGSDGLLGSYLGNAGTDFSHGWRALTPSQQPTTQLSK
jgi:hypothetical protein